MVYCNYTTGYLYQLLPNLSLNTSLFQPLPYQSSIFNITKDKRTNFSKSKARAKPLGLSGRSCCSGSSAWKRRRKLHFRGKVFSLDQTGWVKKGCVGSLGASFKPEEVPGKFQWPGWRSRAGCLERDPGRGSKFFSWSCWCFSTLWGVGRCYTYCYQQREVVSLWQGEKAFMGGFLWSGSLDTNQFYACHSGGKWEIFVMKVIIKEDGFNRKGHSRWSRVIWRVKWLILWESNRFHACHGGRQWEIFIMKVIIKKDVFNQKGHFGWSRVIWRVKLSWWKAVLDLCHEGYHLRRKI